MRHLLMFNRRRCKPFNFSTLSSNPSTNPLLSSVPSNSKWHFPDDGPFVETSLWLKPFLPRCGSILYAIYLVPRKYHRDQQVTSLDGFLTYARIWRKTQEKSGRVEGERRRIEKKKKETDDGREERWRGTGGKRATFLDNGPDNGSSLRS